VSEQFLNGTSAQSGYTEPFTLDHEDKSKTDTTKTNHNPQKTNTKENTAKQS